jgi:hypothetical protein
MVTLCHTNWANYLSAILGVVRSGAGQGYLSYLSYLYLASTQADVTLSTEKRRASSRVTQMFANCPPSFFDLVIGHAETIINT